MVAHDEAEKKEYCYLYSNIVFFSDLITSYCDLIYALYIVPYNYVALMMM